MLFYYLGNGISCVPTVSLLYLETLQRHTCVYYQKAKDKHWCKTRHYTQLIWTSSASERTMFIVQRPSAANENSYFANLSLINLNLIDYYGNCTG